jgi:hypothetical protein
MSRKEQNKNNLITQDTKIYVIRLNKFTSTWRDDPEEIYYQKMKYVQGEVLKKESLLYSLSLAALQNVRQKQ